MTKGIKYPKLTSRRLGEKWFKAGELWAMGRNAKQIGKILNVTYRTAQSHIEHFYQKTGCNSHPETFDWFNNNVWSKGHYYGSRMQGKPDSFNDFRCHSFERDGQLFTCTIPYTAGLTVTFSDS